MQIFQKSACWPTNVCIHFSLKNLLKTKQDIKSNELLNVGSQQLSLELSKLSKLEQTGSIT